MAADWEVPSDVTVGQHIDEDDWNELLGEEGNIQYLKDKVDLINSCVQTTKDEADIVRAMDTVYQNTGDGPRMVCVSLLLAEDENAKVCVDTDVTPSATVAEVDNTNTGSIKVSCTFMVPPGYYYEVLTVDGTPFIREWAEWQLF